MKELVCMCMSAYSQICTDTFSHSFTFDCLALSANSVSLGTRAELQRNKAVLKKWLCKVIKDNISILPFWDILKLPGFTLFGVSELSSLNVQRLFVQIYSYRKN